MKFLILLFLFIFVVWPLLKRLLLWYARRKVRKMAEQFGRQAGFASGVAEDAKGRDGKASSRKGGWSTPAPHRKKIDPSTGDYIRFQEVKTTVETTVETAQTSADGASRTTITTEEQVTDVEWVDLPDK